MAEDARERHPALVDPEQVLAAVTAALGALPGVTVRRGEPLAAHLPLRAGGPADVWVVVEDRASLAPALGIIRQHSQSWRSCWPFEELLVRNGGLRCVVLRPGLGFEGLALLPADEQGPARLRLGAATPWSAVLAALSRVPALAGGPLAELGTWPGCPGGLLSSGDPSVLEGLCHALSWYKGRGVERLVVPESAAPPSSPPSAVLLDIELPLTGRRIRTRRSPPPCGTLFADDGPVPSTPQLRAAGLLGTRLRAWRMAETEPGTLVNRGGGDCDSALLLARGMSEHARRVRGVDLQIRIPVVGSESSRRR